MSNERESVARTGSGKQVHGRSPTGSATFVVEDHEDAAQAHRTLARITDGSDAKRHKWMAGYHSYRADRIAKKKAKPGAAQSDVKKASERTTMSGSDTMVLVKADQGMTPPAGVRAACKRGLEIKGEHGGDGLTGGAVQRARSMASGTAITPDQAKRMRSFFARHAVDKKPGWDSPPTPGYVAWQLWGGDAGRTWANKLVAGMGKSMDKSSWDRAKKQAAKQGKAGDGAYVNAIYQQMCGKSRDAKKPGEGGAEEGSKQQLVGQRLAQEMKDMQKAEREGEGSRGGHIVGHTKSGKPIYGASHGAYSGIQHDGEHIYSMARSENGNLVKQKFADYTSKDHEEAGKLHNKLAAAIKPQVNEAFNAKNHKEGYRLKVDYSKHRDIAAAHHDQKRTVGKTEAKQDAHAKFLASLPQPGQARVDKEPASASYDTYYNPGKYRTPSNKEIPGPGDYSRPLHDALSNGGAGNSLSAADLGRMTAEHFPGYTAEDHDHISSALKERVADLPWTTGQAAEAHDRLKPYQTAHTLAAEHKRGMGKSMPATETLNEFLYKATGAGSRGGHIIGHTKSGKPIYSTTHQSYRSGNFQNRDSDEHTKSPKALASRGTRQRNTVIAEHPSYTAEDHADAAEAHNLNANHNNNVNKGWIISRAHQAAAEHLNSKTEKSMQANDALNDYLSKAGGEGTRGGHIIGHTKSGKPIYNSGHANYAGVGKTQTVGGHGASHAEKVLSAFPRYTAQDHKDAAAAHGKQNRFGESPASATAQSAHEYASRVAKQDSSKGLIGKTQSGKPIHDIKSTVYNDKTRHGVKASHPGYSQQEHWDAMNAHDDKSMKHRIASQTAKEKGDQAGAAKHWKLSGQHEHMAALHSDVAMHMAHRGGKRRDAHAEKSMSSASDLLKSFLSKADSGTDVAACAGLSESDTGETTDGKGPGLAFPRTGQKVSQAAASSDPATQESPPMPLNGFSGHEGNEDAFDGEPNDLHTGELPEVKEENWNPSDANSFEGSSKPQVFGKSSVVQHGIVQYVERGSDARASAIAKGGDFYTGPAPRLYDAMGGRLCKSCDVPMPNCLTACPSCGDGLSMSKGLAACDVAAYARDALAAPHAEQVYRPGGIKIG